MESFTAKQVCEALGISRVTLHRRIVAGDITPLPPNPNHKKRYRLLFPVEEVERLKKVAR